MAVQRRTRILAAGSALAALVAVAVPSAGSPAAAAASRPAPVKNLAAFQLHGPVTLRWTNPRGIDADVVRIAPGSTAPSSVASGRGITLAQAKAAQAVLRDLATGHVYSVSVWTRGAGGLSPRTSTTFTTTAPHPATEPFTGTVTDEAGHPLRNAQVLIGTITQSIKRTKTDAAGHFSVTTGSGYVAIEATGPHATGGTSDATGYGTSPATFASPGHAVHLVLPAGTQVRGRVTDVAGKPVAGMAVTRGDIEPYLWPPMVATGFGLASDVGTGVPHTNRNGYYALRGVPATATVPCAGPSATSGAFAPHCADASVAAAPGRTATAATIVVEHAETGTLTGTVTDQGGRALPHAFLEVIPMRGDSFHLLHADAHGKYRVANLLAGRYEVCATRLGGLGYIGVCHGVKVQGATQRNFALRQGGALSGVVRGPSGHGVGGVAVIAEGQGGTYQSGVAITRRDGSFTVSALGTGNYRVCFDSSTRGAGTTSFAPSCRRQNVVVTPGLNRIGADSALTPGGAVTGVVHAADGTPISDTYVAFELVRNGRLVAFGTAESDGHGRFAVSGLAPGNYRVCAAPGNGGQTEPEQCASSLVVVTAGHTTRHAVVTMAQHPSVLVHVTDASGHALSGVDVGLLGRCTRSQCGVLPVFGARAERVVDTAMTDAAGNAHFLQVPAGYYGVCALAYYGAAASVPAPTGYADKCTDRFPVHATLTSPGSSTLQLDPGGTVSGTIVDGAGHPIRNAVVHIGGASTEGAASNVLSFPPSPFADLRTDSRGRYSVHSVRPGQRSVCATAKGYQRGCLAGKVTVAAATVTSAGPLTLTARAFAAHSVPAGEPQTSAPYCAERQILRRLAYGTFGALLARYPVSGRRWQPRLFAELGHRSGC